MWQQAPLERAATAGERESCPRLLLNANACWGKMSWKLTENVAEISLINFQNSFSWKTLWENSILAYISNRKVK